MQISIIIPAYNESAVIAQTLAPFAGLKSIDDIAVIVVANNCSDDTASVARQCCPSATVLETTTPGKPNAIGMGQEIATGRALVFLDGDLVVPVTGIRALCDPILTGKSQASCGRMKVNLGGASYWVRKFYRGWFLNPYFEKGKFGGMFALSRELAAEIFPIPNIIADDEFISRHAPSDQTAFVPQAEFTVFAPRNLKDLIKIRRRSRRGTLELEQMGLDLAGRCSGGGSLKAIVRRAVSRPSFWIGVTVYAIVITYIRATTRAHHAESGKLVWERDESSRQRGA